jgi:integrase
LKPFFENILLTDINQETVEKWFVYMAAKKVKDRSGNEKTLKNSSIHCGLFTLKTMMAEAARRKLITHNLIEKAREPKVEEKELEILKLSEVKALFPEKWEAVWDNKLVYLANKYMAFTGMRLGEMLGLRGEYIHSDYIRVCGQYGKTGFTKTKTGESRDIPITGAMRYELQELIDLNGEGYLISNNGGKTPISRTFLYAGYKAALERAGIDKTQREKRGLTVHSWRHFFNTLLRASDIADGKVRKVTGHKSMKMTEHYTHFDSREFTDVRMVQERLLDEPEKDKEAVITRKRGMREQQTAIRAPAKKPKTA